MKFILPLSLTTLALILIGTAAFDTQSTTSQQASVALAQQQSIIPTFETEEIEVEEGQVARLVVTLPEPVTKTTRVQFTITPGTARAGTDFTRPTTQTVVFQPNGITSKSISIRTRTDRTQEQEETFSVSLTRVNGKSLPERQTATVTITDRPVTTTTGSSSTPNPRPQENSPTNEAQAKSGTQGTVATRPVTTTSGVGAQTAPVVTAPVSPRCTPGSSTSRGSLPPTQRMFDYAIGQSYHIPFTIPTNWSQKMGRTSHYLMVWNQLGPKTFGEVIPGSPAPIADMSISECPGDFNPQTACVFKGYGVGGFSVEAPTSNRDLVFGSTGGCQIQGGKTYYVNKRVTQCMGAQTCSNEAYSGTGPTWFYDPGYWNDKSRCEALARVSLRDASGNLTGDGVSECRAWGHIQ